MNRVYQILERPLMCCDCLPVLASSDLRDTVHGYFSSVWSCYKDITRTLLELLVQQFLALFTIFYFHVLYKMNKPLHYRVVLFSITNDIRLFLTTLFKNSSEAEVYLVKKIAVLDIE